VTVVEVKQALGSWNLRLQPETPREILSQLDFLGHIVVIPGRLDVRTYGDQLLEVARYVGVNRSKDAAEAYALRGAGMAYWLGDESGKGDIFETAVELTTETFVNSITALLPPGGAVTAGTINAIVGTYSGRHQWETPRKALTYVTELFGAEWRVNGNATLDAGTPTQLGYAVTPRVVLTRFRPSRDLRLAALSGRMGLGKDVEDYSTRVVVLAEGEGAATATGEADAGAIPYFDLHGNPVAITRLVSESSTTPGNADDRAALYLAQFSGERLSVRVNAEAEDIKGDLVVGDWIYLYDSATGFFDNANEVVWEGETINPVSLRVQEMTWPIRDGWTVAYRRPNGTWLDLSPYYVGESGDVQIVVGDLGRSLTGLGSEIVGSRPTGDSSIPGVPVFGDFSVGAYQSAATNTTKAAIRAQWSTPLNTDGTTILDGDRYEIRFRVDTIIGYGVEWAAMEAFRWGDDPPFTWGAPLSEPVQAAPEWQTALVGWGTNAFTLTELTPGVRYEIQIRAVDSATPPHFGAWSTSQLVLASGDLFAPSAPAAPTVAASRIGIMVTHNLGKASGGTFNLEQDLDHLEVHVGGSMDFLCVPASMVGKLTANAAMLGASIPAVGDFKVEQTSGIFVKVVAVDRAGNKSDASAGAAATALLIDNAHISDLSVSKLTAGTITANTILAAMLEIGSGGNVILTEGAVIVRDALGREVMGFGKNPSDSRYGMWVRDPDADIFTVRAGELAAGGYGMEAINAVGELVPLSALAFGLKAATVTAFQSTTSGSFADISGGTVGPIVSDVVVGNTGKMLVFLSCNMQEFASSGGARGGEMSFQLDGPTSLSPALARAMRIGHTDDGRIVSGFSSNNLGVQTTMVVLLTGLSVGTYSLTAKYLSADSPEPITFGNRSIVAIPY
jgi:hypothetical protein